MLFGSTSLHDYSVYALRRKDLVTLVRQEHPEVTSGLIVICAGFENDRTAFRQESSFYYLTGIEEPGVILTLDFHGKSTIYTPQCKTNRNAWVYTAMPLIQENGKTLLIDHFKPAGSPINGYQLHLFSDLDGFSNVLAAMKSVIAAGGSICTVLPNDDRSYPEQRVLFNRFGSTLPELQKSTIDISQCLAIMRRRKDMHEVEQIYKAVEITILAQEAAARAVEDGITECEVQASLEYMFTGSCARPAFPSIVATGKNGTILHYNVNKDTLKNGQLVVVDIGAEFGYYCADITRTYPVSGTFTKRQRELYDLVLATQEYIASIAQPGYWLSNKDNPEKSLHHLAIKYLDERGYGKYFVHGIGHFLGMDVHDVGDLSQPIKDGDIFTIEPGIYIPEENIGIRIEDDYWMAKDTVICLSEALPKKAEDIERMMAQELEDEQEFDDEDEVSDFNDEDDELDLAQG